MSVIPCNGVKSLPDDFVCGEDFCQACGDCLSCYGDDPCMDRDGEEHTYAPSEETPNGD